METYQRLPVAFDSGTGAWLTDVQGDRYLDALAGIAVCGLGHAHPDVERAVAKQAGKLVHTSNLYQVPLQEELALELCALSGLDKVFFCNSGAEANEAAIKICRKYAHEKGNRNPAIIVMEGGFHGRTLATLTATGNRKIKDGFEPLMEGFLHIPYNNFPALEEICRRHDNVAAVMLEPVQGEGGIVIPESGYLQRISGFCRDNDLLLVLDEVQTGLCRTGKWFAFQHEQVKPDVVTLAKSLGNGVPIGACLASAKAALPMVPGSHASTFGGNPLASAAALAVIRYLKVNRMEDRAAALGQDILDQLGSSLAGMNGVSEVRGRGLMIGIELETACPEIVSIALKRKLLVNVTAGKVIRLLPPLIINKEEADRIISLVTASIGEFMAGRQL